MKPAQYKAALNVCVESARAVGKLMLANRRSRKKINEATQHDIKLELDVRSQKLIERTLRKQFPEIPVLGEEGVVGGTTADYRWVVDPIDGTVNFTYGIPHACPAIALQARVGEGQTDQDYQTVVGVIYDPFTDELYTAVRGQPARLNGRVIKASKHTKLAECIISIGFSKDKETLELMLPTFNDLVHRVRKIRIMGSAALALAYVAAGRFDAYVEGGLRLWDIAAGGLLLECAGGEFLNYPVKGDHKFRIIANNGLLRRDLEKYIRTKPAK